MFVVSGVTGHVGSGVANELLAKGLKVKVIVRDAAKGAPWSKKGAEIAVGTLEDQAFLTTALKSAEGFFAMLPPNFAVPDIYAYQRTLVAAIAGAVKASGVPQVAMLSSIGADVEVGNGPIKGTHWLEKALRETGTKLSAIRAGSFQENIKNALGAAKAGVYPSFGSPDYPVPMIATKDIAHQIVESLTKPPAKSEVVDLHGPAYTARQIAEKLGKKIGISLRVTEIPQAGFLDALLQAGLPKQAAESMAEMYTGFSQGKLTPKGDRMAHGKTEIDELIATLG